MTDTPTTLVCPKCQGPMRTYERNSVIIDQCTDCRGVFLDRGELDRLIDAEAQRYGTAPASFPPPPNADSSRDDDRRYDPREDRHGGGHHGDSKSSKRRRGGFLGELFD
ncbi:MAG: zf-TFIIB domain-containing protein [Candidatus Nanopelagicales bacterium]